MLFGTLAIVLTAAVIFGGGTRSGHIGDVIVQVLAVVVLVVAFSPAGRQRNAARGGDGYSGPEYPVPGQAVSSRARYGVGSAPVGSGSGLPETGAVARPGAVAGSQAGPPRQEHGSTVASHWLLFSLVVGLSLVQLLPLPGSLARFPAPFPDGMQALATGFWSVAIVPDAALAAITSTIVPLAIFCGAVALTRRERLRLALVVLCLGVGSAVLGLVQEAQGPTSPLRFFDFTNSTEAVGFFANRNHLATLLCISIVLTAVFLVDAIARIAQAGRLTPADILRLCGVFATIIVLVGTIFLTRSRAGVAMAMIALVAIGLVAASSARLRSGPINAGRARGWSLRSPGRASLLMIVAGLVVIAEIGLHRVLSRFDVDVLQDQRVTFSIATGSAAWDAMPLGAGFGSFLPVYGLREAQGNLFSAYANRAHNDLAEVVLETGAAGAVLIVLFLIWYIVRGAAAWIRSSAGEPDYSAHVILQRTASIALLLPLLHSLVDYPLRTTAIAAVFAFMCAMLLPARLDAVEASPGAGRRSRGRERSSRDFSGASPGPTSGIGVRGQAWQRPASEIVPPALPSHPPRLPPQPVRGEPGATPPSPSAPLNPQLVWPEKWRQTPGASIDGKKRRDPE